MARGDQFITASGGRGSRVVWAALFVAGMIAGYTVHGVMPGRPMSVYEGGVHAVGGGGPGCKDGGGLRQQGDSPTPTALAATLTPPPPSPPPSSQPPAPYDSTVPSPPVLPWPAAVDVAEGVGGVVPPFPDVVGAMPFCAATPTPPPQPGRVPPQFDVRHVAVLVVTDNNMLDRVDRSRRTWVRWFPPTIAATNLFWVAQRADPSVPLFASPHSEGGYDKSQRKWRDGLAYMLPRLARDVHWVLVADDDAYVVLPHLIAFMNTRNVSHGTYYGQQCSRWRPDGREDDVGVFCGGATVLLPRWVAERLACAMGRLPYPPPYGVGHKVDVVMSRVVGVELPDIVFQDCKEFCSQPPMFYVEGASQVQVGMRDKPAGWGQVISWHYMTDEKMMMLLTNVLAGIFPIPLPVP